MMEIVVKMLTDDDGEKHNSSKWHYVVNWDGTKRTLCTGECFGIGESSAEFKTKEMKRGAVTCDECLDKIKQLKKYRL